MASIYEYNSIVFHDVLTTEDLFGFWWNEKNRRAVVILPHTLSTGRILIHPWVDKPSHIFRWVYRPNFINRLIHPIAVIILNLSIGSDPIRHMYVTSNGSRFNYCSLPLPQYYIGIYITLNISSRSWVIICSEISKEYFLIIYFDRSL